jgi:hypothetical protein
MGEDQQTDTHSTSCPPNNLCCVETRARPVGFLARHILMVQKREFACENMQEFVTRTSQTRLGISPEALVCSIIERLLDFPMRKELQEMR